jgi:PAS domain-containing protein
MVGSLMSSLQFPAVLWLFVISSACSFGIGSYAVWYSYRREWRRRVVLFGVITILMSVWVATAASKIVSADLAVKTLWYRLEFLGHAWLPSLFILLALDYVAPERITRRLYAVLLAVPVATVALALGAPQGVFIDTVLVDAGNGYVALEQRSNLLFGIHTLWSVGTTVAMTTAIVWAAVRRQVPRFIAVIFGIAPLVPAAVFALRTLQVYPPGGSGFDITPAAVSVTILIDSVIVYRHRVFDRVHTGRSQALDIHPAGYLLVHESGHIVDANAAAADLIGVPDCETLIADDLTEYLPAALRSEGDQQLKLGDRTVFVERSTIQGAGGTGGYALLLTDITELILARDQLRVERDGKEAVRKLLLETTSMANIAAVVCEQLIDLYGYAGAWVYPEPVSELADRMGEPLARQTGDVQRPPAAVALDTAATNATRTGKPVEQSPDQGIDTHDDAGGDQSPWDGRLRAIPLTHSGVVSGALVVHETGAQAGQNREVLDEFASALGFKQQVHARREVLTTDEVRELSVSIADDSHVLLRLLELAEISTPVDVVRTEQCGGTDNEPEQAIYVLQTERSAAERLVDTALELDEILAIERLTESETTATVRVRAATRTVGNVVKCCGGFVTAFSVSTREVSVVAEFPMKKPTSAVMSDLRSLWPSVVLRAKRTEQVPTDRSVPKAGLTQKQLETLKTATELGFFERPQQATADDVASAMGVSRTACLGHIRAAEQQVFSDLFVSRERQSLPNDD